MKELLKALNALERLGAEWQADCPGGDWTTVRFFKDAEDGIYKGSISLNEGHIIINVTVSNGAGEITLFNEGYARGKKEFRYLECYARTRMEEVLDGARDKFLGRRIRH